MRAVEAPERYLTVGELAEAMGVSRSTVKRWTSAGMPSHTFGMRRTRRYLLSECIAWVEERESSTINGTPGDHRKAPGQPKE